MLKTDIKLANNLLEKNKFFNYVNTNIIDKNIKSHDNVSYENIEYSNQKSSINLLNNQNDFNNNQINCKIETETEKDIQIENNSHNLNNNNNNNLNNNNNKDFNDIIPYQSSDISGLLTLINVCEKCEYIPSNKRKYNIQSRKIIKVKGIEKAKDDILDNNMCCICRKVTPEDRINKNLNNFICNNCLNSIKLYDNLQKEKVTCSSCKKEVLKRDCFKLDSGLICMNCSIVSTRKIEDFRDASGYYDDETVCCNRGKHNRPLYTFIRKTGRKGYKRVSTCYYCCNKQHLRKVKRNK